VPVLEEMKLYLTDTLVKKYMADGTIEAAPLEYMRGRNFHNCFMVLDEAQNTTHEQIKMFITRIGRKSKAVVNGDIDQSDLPPAARGALENCLDKLEDINLVGIVELTDDDIVRNRIISAILAKL
jgi:phosphate starvation-inducible PhoH-like protein